MSRKYFCFGFLKANTHICMYVISTLKLDTKVTYHRMFDLAYILGNL